MNDETTMKASDTQVAGDHYKRLSPEPWEIMEGWNRDHFVGFLRYSALKRLGRWDSKDNALQDVRKAIHELTRVAELLEEDQEQREKLAEEVRKDREQRAEELSKWHESNPCATVPKPPEPRRGILRNNTDGVHPAASRIAQQIREAKHARDDVLPAAKATMPTEPEEHVHDRRKGPGNPYT